MTATCTTTTTNTLTVDVPLGTEKVPDDVNVWYCKALIVIENALSFVLELAAAPIVKLDVVFEPGFVGVPEITAPELVEVKDKPEGKEPLSKVYVISPPDSGSVPEIVTSDQENDVPVNKLPAAVENANINIKCVC